MIPYVANYEILTSTDGQASEQYLEEWWRSSDIKRRSLLLLCLTERHYRRWRHDTQWREEAGSKAGGGRLYTRRWPSGSLTILRGVIWVSRCVLRARRLWDDSCSPFGGCSTTIRALVAVLSVDSCSQHRWLKVQGKLTMPAQTDLYTVSPKNVTLCHFSIFTKCQSIFKILSLAHSPDNWQQSDYWMFHHTVTVSLHCLVKYKCNKK